MVYETRSLSKLTLLVHIVSLVSPVVLEWLWVAASFSTSTLCQPETPIWRLNGQKTPHPASLGVSFMKCRDEDAAQHWVEHPQSVRNSLENVFFFFRVGGWSDKWIHQSECPIIRLRLGWWTSHCPVFRDATVRRRTSRQCHLPARSVLPNGYGL